MEEKDFDEREFGWIDTLSLDGWWYESKRRESRKHGILREARGRYPEERSRKNRIGGVCNGREVFREY